MSYVGIEGSAGIPDDPIIKEISKLHLNDGDVLVVKIPIVTAVQHDNICRALDLLFKKQEYPKRHITWIVLSDNVELSVLSAEEKQKMDEAEEHRLIRLGDENVE